MSFYYGMGEGLSVCESWKPTSKNPMILHEQPWLSLDQQSQPIAFSLTVVKIPA